MASIEEPEVSARIVSADSIGELEGARVALTGEERLRVEFSIQDLVKLLRPGVAVAHCGGCNGCMGCSM